MRLKVIQDTMNMFGERKRRGAPMFCFVMPPDEDYGPTGGAIATVTRGLASALTRQGLRVEVIATAKRPHYQGAGDVRVHWTRRILQAVLFRLLRPLDSYLPSCPPGYVAYLAGLLPTLMFHSRPRVIIIQNDLQLPSLVRWLFRKTTIIFWVHNRFDASTSKVESVLASADYVVAVSQNLGDWLIEKYGVDAEKLSVLHNGVDVAVFCPSGVSDPQDGSFRVVCHGRLDPHKGFHIVAQAIRRLRRDGINVSLTLAGPKLIWGMPRKDAEAYWSHLLSLLEEGAGTYLGRVDPRELPTLLRSHQIACAISTDDDAFNLSALEAMASGCATVISNRGGLPEMAGDGCIVVEPEVNELVAVLGSLMRDEKYLSATRLRSLERARQLTWQNSAAGLMTLLDESVKKG